ncbi:hypothetical protein BJX96DRAFT_106395 [Aspergillus floccosus]
MCVRDRPFRCSPLTRGSHTPPLPLLCGNAIVDRGSHSQILVRAHTYTPTHDDHAGPTAIWRGVKLNTGSRLSRGNGETCRWRESKSRNVVASRAASHVIGMSGSEDALHTPPFGIHGLSPCSTSAMILILISHRCVILPAAVRSQETLKE